MAKRKVGPLGFPAWTISRGEQGVTLLTDPAGARVVAVFTNPELAERFATRLLGAGHHATPIPDPAACIGALTQLKSTGATDVEVNPTTDPGTSGQRFPISGFITGLRLEFGL
jgi:hypothetical protein